MIETHKQAVDAINKIKTKTGWSLSKIASKADLSPRTVISLAKDDDVSIRDETCRKIDTLLSRVNKLK